MIKRLYSIAFVDSLYEYGLLLKSYTTNSSGNFNDQCTNISKIFSNDLQSNVNAICTKVMSYLENIHKTSDNRLITSSCIYLYYWIYEEFKKQEKDNSIYTKMIYDLLIMVYNNRGNISICNNYAKTIFNDEEMLKLKDIYDMVTILHDLNKEGACSNEEKPNCTNQCFNTYIKYEAECKFNNDHYFCKILNDFRNAYNTKLRNLSGANIHYKLLPSFHTYNIKLTVIIPVLVALITSVILFMLYKFTAFGSYISQSIIREKNVFNVIAKKRNILEQSDISSNIPNNRKYNVYYNFT
ncbi:variable surface protein [Plasmodium gonderi]|uniref:Variable surface protein n=1 Tax=Plasmodium gonderi TaxID=77519 RepID=A0A1Y1JNC8_PLAGO|nr:variable surface protein [Plasmodium gonderi]GAW82737.1 variable surface protein [Plasmodium gonderi]